MTRLEELLEECRRRNRGRRKRRRRSANLTVRAGSLEAAVVELVRRAVRDELERALPPIAQREASGGEAAAEYLTAAEAGDLARVREETVVDGSAAAICPGTTRDASFSSGETSWRGIWLEGRSRRGGRRMRSGSALWFA
jgi:hypothetical protein